MLLPKLFMGDNMNIDIRNYVKDNFKDATNEDIKSSIEEAIKKGDDVTLPGLGYFFEIVWNFSSDEGKDKILNTLSQNLK